MIYNIIIFRVDDIVIICLFAISPSTNGYMVKYFQLSCQFKCLKHQWSSASVLRAQFEMFWPFNCGWIVGGLIFLNFVCLLLKCTVLVTYLECHETGCAIMLFPLLSSEDMSSVVTTFNHFSCWVLVIRL